MVLLPALCQLLRNPVENSGLLNELARSVDVQENPISKKAGLRKVARPHFEVVLRDLDSLVLLEELGQLPDLLKFLSSEHLLYQNVQKLKHTMGQFSPHLLGLVKVERGFVTEVQLTLLTVGRGWDQELRLLVLLHGEDIFRLLSLVTPASNKIAE